MTRDLFYTDTHDFHPELTLEWQDGFVSNSLACFLTDTYGIISIMHGVWFWAHEIWNLGLKSVHLLTLTKCHKYIFTPVQVSYKLTFVTLAGLLSLFTHKLGWHCFMKNFKISELKLSEHYRSHWQYWILPSATFIWHHSCTKKRIDSAW